MSMTIFTDEMRKAAARALHDHLWGNEGPVKETTYLAMREQLLVSVNAVLSAIEPHVAGVVEAAIEARNALAECGVGVRSEADALDQALTPWRKP